MYRFFSFLLFTFFFLEATSQPVAPKSASGIYQEIKKLDVLGSVLYIAAHPDDENTRLLAYLANEKQYRTGYLSITRGDGGQNLIGDEQGIELGLIRTRELLAARALDGAEQLFTRAYDFGYSKNPEETFSIWDKQKILSDVVWVIRKFKPDVIITRFPTTGEGGHGHHTASAILAVEAFDAAADPNMFPEQLKNGVTPWQAKRLLWNTFNFGNRNTTSEDQFKLEVGGYNPLLGKSYGEIAAESRSQHKSQGFGVPASRGIQYEYFKTLKGTAPIKILMDGVATDWDRLMHADIHRSIQTTLKDFSFAQPQKSIPALLQILRQVKKTGDPYWRNLKEAQVKNVIAACAGLYLEAATHNRYAVQGDSVPITLLAINRLGSTASVDVVKINGQPIKIGETLQTNKNWEQNFSLMIPANAPVSQPYWLRSAMGAGSYIVPDIADIGKPWNDPFTIDMTVSISGEKLLFHIPVQYKSNDPVKGEVFEPLLIIPAVEVQTSPELALSINHAPVAVSFLAHNNLHTGQPVNVDTSYSQNVHVDTISGEPKFYVNDAAAPHNEQISASANAYGQHFDQYKKVIRYEHIPPIVYFKKAETRLESIELKIAGKRAGYIAGAGDKIPDALQKMGYEVTMLTREDIMPGNLQQFDVIVTGVRAYNIHEWLNNAYDVLMNYVKEGGVLLTQYNTNNNIGPVKAKIGPYPFQISRTRVTDENAHVTFTDTESVLVNYPNKIAPRDFTNWIQERSTYHAAAYDAHYKTLFSMGDNAEAEDAGSLIYTDYGKGRFIYTGLVFFRELPAGVPGAYRLFANLIASPRE